MGTSTGTRTTATVNRTYAAVFIDFDSIYHYLRQSYGDIRDLSDYIFDMLRNLQRQLERRFAMQTTIVKAYGHFEPLSGNLQGALYRMGIDAHNVPGTEYDNAADIKLAIDVMETLYTHPEIETFVLMTGDRDFIPVIQHLKQRARSVMGVAFKGVFTADFLAYVGPQSYLDLASLLDPAMVHRLEEYARRYRDYDGGRRDYEEYRQPEAAPETNWEQRREYIEPAVPQPHGIGFSTNEPVTGENERICLEVLMKNYGHHPEVWISPFLRKLSDALPRLADFERKALLNTLEYQGAIRIEKRRGEPYDYSIIVINHEHPTVREISEALNEAGHQGGAEDDGYDVEEEEPSAIED
jgi:hypothetical protein